MSSTLMRSSIALAALTLLVHEPVAGQFGGLGNRVRRAVQEATAEKPTDPTPAPATPAAITSAKESASGPYNEHVLEMTPAILDRLAVALAAEETERKEVARVAASVRTPEAYEQCAIGVAMSAEGQALTQEMTARASAYMANTSDVAAGTAYRQAQEAAMAHTREKCGPDPDQFRSSELPALQARPEKLGREAGGFTVDQYAILKERIAPLCLMAVGADGGEIRIPGEGENIFWVYSASEVELLRPRCGTLSPLVQATL